MHACADEAADLRKILQEFLLYGARCSGIAALVLDVATMKSGLLLFCDTCDAPLPIPTGRYYCTGALLFWDNIDERFARRSRKC